MPPARLKNIFLLFTFCLLSFGSFIFFNTRFAIATLESCSASISPSTIMTSSSANFIITLTNTGSNPILYFQINSPSSEFTIQGKNVDGWSGTSNSTFAQFWGGSLISGSSLNIELSITTGINELPSSNWIFDANDTLSTDGLTRCTGSLGVAISGVADFVGPTISETIAISEINDTSATFGWATDEASTSKVTYGTGEGLDEQFKENTSLVTTHSVTITGLTASTTYYYSVCNSDVSNNQTCSDYGEFTTASVGSQAPATTTTVTTTTTTTVIITPTPAPKDTISPSIGITTDFTDPYKEAPTIEGKSNDGGAVNVGVAAIDYSLDGGKNWLPVDNIDTVGKKSVSYDFTPVGLDDGNYQIKVRAKDSTGNIGSSKVFTLVIDRLPPQVGGTLFSLGPMILRPDSRGFIYSIAGQNIKVALSAVGGPINMDLLYNSEKFSLQKNVESGLWGGILNINQEGVYKLLARSIDGANNETERSLSTIVSLSPGKVLDENSHPLAKAKIKVYIFEKTLNDFTLWDAEPYSQINPQDTNESGEYRLILPAGKYFLEVESAGKRKLRSEIFQLELATPINQVFKLDKALLFFGNWWSKSVQITQTNTSSPSNQNSSLIGKFMPDFEINTQGNVFNNSSLLGKPTVLTFLSTWEPQTSDQLLSLDNLKNEHSGINVIAVATQESGSSVDVFKKIGGYNLPIQADPDGVLVTPLGLESLPTHIFIDRKGIIKDVVTGYLDNLSLLTKILN